MKSIAIDQLQEKTNTGLQIKVFRSDETEEHKAAMADAHRDDHYIFFLLTNGSGTLMVDLKDVHVTAGQLYYVLPSQVHHRIKADRAEGWFLAVDTSLVRPDFRDVFEKSKNLQVPASLTHYELKQYSNLLNLLREEYTERKNDSYYLPIIHTLVQSFLAMAASTYSIPQTTENIPVRAAELARQFKDMLSLHIRTIKSPSEYASRLMFH